MNSFRSKPVGWRYESHRHSLASRGIRTIFSRKKINIGYFSDEKKEKDSIDKYNDINNDRELDRLLRLYKSSLILGGKINTPKGIDLKENKKISEVEKEESFKSWSDTIGDFSEKRGLEREISNKRERKRFKCSLSKYGLTEKQKDNIMKRHGY
jgi:hypothetical protein